jgi:hypothetical protein
VVGFERIGWANEGFWGAKGGGALWELRVQELKLSSESCWPLAEDREVAAFAQLVISAQMPFTVAGKLVEE